ncbi:hypothetical protein [Niallia taxi]|uniref:hypothetical protein n=1 Tax=Niallia taxi TaxID=2499688 RepID=UPI00254F8891|nr:hypothetical protein [Niallia taxi]MDK8641692.1 hypothetical protein [Niallia taxi]
MTTSTDVKHSIAGYYYQLLLACRELVNLIDNNHKKSFVAIEKGADIRVYNGNDLSIEAKFYKAKNFTRKSNAIRHTIYNFSYLFKEHKNKGNSNPEFMFKTNIQISSKDKTFFEDWDKGEKNTDKTEYINYIKDCLVYESIQRKPISDLFKSYKDNHHTKYKEDAQYFNDLIVDIYNGKKSYSQFINPDRLLTDIELIEFLQAINFKFEDNCFTKVYIIDEIKKEINTTLQRYDTNLTIDDCNHISSVVLEKFFESTYNNKVSEIYIEDLHNIVKNKNEYTLKHIEQYEIRKSIDVINTNLKLYSKNLGRNNPTEIKNRIMDMLIETKEEIFNEIEIYGFEDVLKRYIMGIETNSNLLISMFKPFLELKAISKKQLGQLLIVDLQGINNIKYSNHGQFALKGTSSDEEKKNEYTLLGSFFNDIDEKNQFAKLDDTDFVIFDCDDRCKPCQYDKNNISEIVFDIADTTNILQIQAYYKSLNFRCSHCLSLNSNEQCDFSNDLKG